ncbi:MAG: ComF family protein [Patescibacteria group bacterium]
MEFFNKILLALFPQKCFGCKKENEILCAGCLHKISRPDTPYLNGIHISANYQDFVLKKALWALKYQGVKQLAKPLAELIKERIWKKLETKGWLIVSIPISKNKLRKRGYNQAELLARCLFNFQTDAILGGGILSKIKETVSQVEIKEKEKRLTNIAGSFRVEKPESVKGKKIILVDDVFTTGATINEAKKVLKKAGAKKVVGVVLARG